MYVGFFIPPLKDANRTSIVVVLMIPLRNQVVIKQSDCLAVWDNRESHKCVFYLGKYIYKK